jgi:hypothetical protein
VEKNSEREFETVLVLALRGASEDLMGRYKQGIELPAPLQKLLGLYNDYVKAKSTIEGGENKKQFLKTPSYNELAIAGNHHYYIAEEYNIDETGQLHNEPRYQYGTVEDRLKVSDFKKHLDYLGNEENLSEIAFNGQDESIFYAAMLAESDRERAALSGHLLAILDEARQDEAAVGKNGALAMAGGGTNTLKHMQYLNLTEANHLAMGKLHEAELQKRQKETTKNEYKVVQVKKGQKVVANPQDYNAILPPQKVVSNLKKAVEGHEKLMQALKKSFADEKLNLQEKIDRMAKKIADFLIENM